MIIQNMIVGKDRHGKEIRCGDICSFQIRFDSGNSFKRRKDNIIKNMKGIIVYDYETCAFAFATLDKNAPMLLIHVVEYGSIEYEVSIGNNYGFIERDGDGGFREATYCDDKTASEWHRIYKEHAVMIR